MIRHTNVYRIGLAPCVSMWGIKPKFDTLVITAKLLLNKEHNYQY